MYMCACICICVCVNVDVNAHGLECYFLFFLWCGSGKQNYRTKYYFFFLGSTLCGNIGYKKNIGSTLSGNI
jgi:hypothetical protein